MCCGDLRATFYKPQLCGIVDPDRIDGKGAIFFIFPSNRYHGASIVNWKPGAICFAMARISCLARSSF
jgi:hypothetical protein